MSKMMLVAVIAAMLTAVAPAKAEKFAELARFGENPPCMEMVAFGGKMIFTTYDDMPPDYGSFTLWRTDGTSKGAGLLRHFKGAKAYSLTVSERAVYSLVDFGQKRAGAELWRTDGAPSRTLLVEGAD